MTCSKMLYYLSSVDCISQILYVTAQFLVTLVRMHINFTIYPFMFFQSLSLTLFLLHRVFRSCCCCYCVFFSCVSGINVPKKNRIACVYFQAVKKRPSINFSHFDFQSVHVLLYFCLFSSMILFPIHPLSGCPMPSLYCFSGKFRASQRERERKMRIFT